MNVLPQEAYKIKLPKMIKVTQLFDDSKIDADRIPSVVREQINKKDILSTLDSGKTVALLVGSRGIASLDIVVKATIDSLVENGLKPFIVPSMGSHGGGIASEQQKIIESYGITEQNMGVPIVSNMDTEIVGKIDGNIPVHVAKDALKADFVIPIVRVKQHTDFEGPIESGLCKMLSIGIGKHNGCSRLHMEGFASFGELIPKAAEIVLEKVNVPFGIAIVENAHDFVHTIEVVKGTDILTEEPRLLELSKKLMPKLQFKEIDVLIIKQIGKNISGAGMDPKIVGRVNKEVIRNYDGPTIKRIIISGLTEKTHHNATGVGLADYITKEAYDEIDLQATYTNCIAAGEPEAGKIPIIMDNEEEALRAAIMTCEKIDVNNAKIVKIQDTSHLMDIEVSSNMSYLCSDRNKFIIKSPY